MGRKERDGVLHLECIRGQRVRQRAAKDSMYAWRSRWMGWRERVGVCIRVVVGVGAGWGVGQGRNIPSFTGSTSTVTTTDEFKPVGPAATTVTRRPRRPAS